MGREVELRRVRKNLEKIRDSTRLTINEALRPSLRPLKILDLPDELLRHIFLLVRGNTSMYELAFFDMHPGDVKQIQKLRLTCKRFCETSSHLLMFYVKINLTPESLAHLDQVAQHPLISKGIRALKVCLGRHFDSDIAHDIRAFAQYQATRLRSHIEGWEMIVQHPSIFDHTPPEVVQRAIDRAVSVSESFEAAAQHGVNENCREHVLLGKAQEIYRQGYGSQLLLHGGAFAQAIASAMVRMPTASWLNIQDEDIYSSFAAKNRLQAFCPEDLENYDMLQLKLQAPNFSWSMARYQGLRSPPADVIPSILLSTGEAGTGLIGLDIDIPPPDNLSSLSAAQVEPPKLQAASQQLRSFTFRPRRGESLPMETLSVLRGFLATIIHTSSLQRISLCFDFMYEAISGQPTVSMAPILLSHAWPSLRELEFNGPFYFEDLQKVVNSIVEHVTLQWSGYLMDASWVEVLDFLRGHGSCAGITLGDVNGSIAGAECEHMTREEVDFIFSRSVSKGHWRSMGRATEYVQGWTTQNPIVDWENGELEMPQPIAEDEEDQETESVTDDQVPD
ncbi:hypothetical protein Daus18300_012710 [Diaporthe australafricana]|uniref:F-box domain-containing protein n=1 Tax=Diaporthe australafricana TaxID=127596 RepID=A0ABR3W1W2_9PEZI